MLAPVSITGIGKCVPEKVVTNDELTAFVETSDEWISKRTGIRSRHVAVDETATGLAVSAARSALVMSGEAPENVGVIVACTITGGRTHAFSGGTRAESTRCSRLRGVGCFGRLYGLCLRARDSGFADGHVASGRRHRGRE